MTKKNVYEYVKFFDDDDDDDDDKVINRWRSSGDFAQSFAHFAVILIKTMWTFFVHASLLNKLFSSCWTH